MLATWCYRVASVLLALFAILHHLGFRQTKPEWGVDAVLAQLKSITFQVPGAARRTYYDFYAGFGFFVTVLLLFAALAAWQLGAVPGAVRAGLALIAWGLPATFAVVTWLSWRYFFTPPLMFSLPITVLLLVGALFGAG